MAETMATGTDKTRPHEHDTTSTAALLAVMMWWGGFPPLAGGLMLGGAIAKRGGPDRDGVLTDVFDLGYLCLVLAGGRPPIEAEGPAK